MKVVIVGGVAGGMSAATRLRRLKEDAEIVIFEKGPFVSFANCGLPYYVSGEITERSNLLVQTPESLKARFNLDVRPFHEVVAIHPDKKIVTVRNSEGTFEETYDSLILSPGAKPVIPPIDGIEEASNVFHLRNVPDMDAIMAHIEHTNPKTATVVGAGFIGVEMAESLRNRGMKVTIVEKAPHVLPPLDEEMAAYVQKELRRNDVTVHTAQSVIAFRDHGATIVLEDQSTIQSDITILSVGVQPESTLAKKAGIEVGLRGGILVDNQYETNVKDIYAVGDAIIVNNQITGTDALISLASPANRQGRQVADVIAGLSRKNKGSIGTAIVRVFELSAASTGLSERVAKQQGLDVAVVHTTGKDHAGYFPGATDVTMKLIFDKKTGAIYGAQGVGKKGVDKRIDVLATAIKAGLTVEDLPELEFTYAPPFGSAKDPVNMLGYAALNIIEGLSESIQWYELDEAVENGSILLDVRSDMERNNNGTFKKALNIPLDELRDRMNELDRDESYIIACHSGLRSYIGERMMKQAGLNVKNLDGAFVLYDTVQTKE